MRTPPAYLAGWELVVNAFGYWPAFHDAHLIGFRYEPTRPDCVTFAVHGFEMTSETDERGYFILVKHHLVTLRFEDIGAPRVESSRWTGTESETLVSDRLETFGPHSILDQWVFSETRGDDGRFEVDLVTHMEADVSFRARSGQIVSVAPCAEDLKG